MTTTNATRAAGIEPLENEANRKLPGGVRTKSRRSIPYGYRESTGPVWITLARFGTHWRPIPTISRLWSPRVISRTTRPIAEISSGPRFDRAPPIHRAGPPRRRQRRQGRVPGRQPFRGCRGAVGGGWSLGEWNLDRVPVSSGHTLIVRNLISARGGYITFPSGAHFYNRLGNQPTT